MIQRVQSIWLFLAVVTLICLFFLPLLTKTVDGNSYGVYTSGIHTENEATDVSVSGVEFAVIPITLSIGAILLSFGAIFFYKNRRLQKNIILAAILFIIALAASCFYIGQDLPGGTIGTSVTIGTFLPLLATVFCLLAIRGIRKDEQLLKSADRLR
jgi:vacuolar-type H+-ATPase subunit I/STV1